jgi:cytolysin (calcineurin-like family phosphatase)
MVEHKMRSSVTGGERDVRYVINMDAKINSLRREIWRTIFVKNKELNPSDCDIAMALGMVVYELIHHCDAAEPPNVDGRNIL